MGLRHLLYTGATIMGGSSSIYFMNKEMTNDEVAESLRLGIGSAIALATVVGTYANLRAYNRGREDRENLPPNR